MHVARDKAVVCVPGPAGCTGCSPPPCLPPSKVLSFSLPRMSKLLTRYSAVAKGPSEADTLQDMLLAVTKKANTAEEGTKTVRMAMLTPVPSFSRCERHAQVYRVRYVTFTNM